VLQLEVQLADRDRHDRIVGAGESLAHSARFTTRQMGARPMARVIQEHIKKPLAERSAVRQAERRRPMFGFVVVKGRSGRRRGTRKNRLRVPRRTGHAEAGEKLPGARAKRTPAAQARNRVVLHRVAGRRARFPRGRWSRSEWTAPRIEKAGACRRLFCCRIPKEGRGRTRRFSARTTAERSGPSNLRRSDSEWRGSPPRPIRAGSGWFAPIRTEKPVRLPCRPRQTIFAFEGAALLGDQQIKSRRASNAVLSNSTFTPSSEKLRTHAIHRRAARVVGDDAAVDDACGGRFAVVRS